MTREDRAGRGRVEVAYDCFRFKHVEPFARRFFSVKKRKPLFLFSLSATP